MSQPIIADTKPAIVSLEENHTYAWCACGRSANQPFCDGSHRGTDFTPKSFSVDTAQEAHLCLCKRTGNAPFCDGTHRSLSGDEAGRVAPPRAAAGDPRATSEEPTVEKIHALARDGLSKTGHHGEMGAMGVPFPTLPRWDDIQIIVGQFAIKPLQDDVQIDSRTVIGPRAKRPLELNIPLFVSDMSFGALSEEAKRALAAGAELAGTGICSGEGGMLPEEKAANSRYFYELASAKFGYREELLRDVQAFHFKGGQGAKTGTGGHLPGSKVVGRIAEVRGLPEGSPAISPATFHDLSTPEDYRRFADRVREVSGGIPIGFKMSANHIERDLAFAIEASADYIILDGRGGGTGAAPLIFRDHISVPTLPALARARHYLDSNGHGDITLVVTGGLRMPADFVKALCLGANAVAIANSAMQAVGCVAARMCNTNNCPAGIATQKPELRALVKIDEAAERLARFLEASTDLMKILARACGHQNLSEFGRDDIATWNKEIAELTDIPYSGFDASR